MSRSIRTLPLLTRPVLRVHPSIRFQHSLLRERGRVNIQPVRFRSPPIRYSRILRFAAQVALTSFLIYLGNEYFLGYEEEVDEREPETTAPSIAIAPTPLQQGIEGTKAPEAEQVEELIIELPEKAPENAIFIPLWRGKPRPATKYTTSDPEWQEYVKFSQDGKSIRAAKDALAFQVLGLTKSSPLVKTLGAPIQVQQTGLTIHYPGGPPPEYDRLGIEIADDYVALTSRPQSLENYRRVTSVLWPEAIGLAFYQSFRLYCGLQYMRIVGFLNTKTETENPRDPASPNPFDFLNKMTKSSEKQDDQLGSKMEKLSDPKSTDSKTASASPAGTNAAKPSITGGSTDSANILSYLPSLKRSEGDLGSAVHVFKSTLAQNWHDQGIVDRGAVGMVGFVEVAGSKMKLQVAVAATYHPKTKQVKVLRIKPRRLMPTKLRPPT